jgi:uncharacterized protein YeaO (DUF488 family)
MLKLKRVYEKRQNSEGKRILIDRLWPRGLTKEQAAIDEWLKDLAPSEELRKWFGHEPDKFPEFRKKYLKELAGPVQQPLLEQIAGMAAKTDVTLVYGAKDTEHNNAVVIAEAVGEIIQGKGPKK